jgi:prepilin-type N-terminal cleavage/methylation domain-containing protein
MVYNIMSTKSARRRKSGFSLVELLVALGIGLLMLTALGGLTFYSGRSFAAMANYVDLDTKSRSALDRMSSEIRQTQYLMDATDTKLVFKDADGGKLTYTYNASTRKLIRSKNDVSDRKPLLTECNSLKFSIFQRNPIVGTYDQYPTATPATCKLVQLRWVCSRDLITEKRNTESVQSAKIVIRQQ